MSSQTPMNYKGALYLYEGNVKELLNGGYWMMFFNKKQMNTKWQKAVSLFQNKELDVEYISCSTSLKNPNEGVIFFYCSKSFQKSRIMRIGKELMDLMEYCQTMYYQRSKVKLYRNLNTCKYKILYDFNAFADDSD